MMAYNDILFPRPYLISEDSGKLALKVLNFISGEFRMLFKSEFATLLCEIEAYLNSRPALSNDPSDLSALTPGHFLIDRSFPYRKSQYSRSMRTGCRDSSSCNHAGTYLALLIEKLFALITNSQSGPQSDIKANDLIILIRNSLLPPSRWKFVLYKCIQIRMDTFVSLGDFRYGLLSL